MVYLMMRGCWWYRCVVKAMMLSEPCSCAKGCELGYLLSSTLPLPAWQSTTPAQPSDQMISYHITSLPADQMLTPLKRGGVTLLRHELTNLATFFFPLALGLFQEAVTGGNHSQIIPCRSCTAVLQLFSGRMLRLASCALWICALLASSLPAKLYMQACNLAQCVGC